MKLPNCVLSELPLLRQEVYFVVERTKKYLFALALSLSAYLLCALFEVMPAGGNQLRAAATDKLDTSHATKFMTSKLWLRSGLRASEAPSALSETDYEIPCAAQHMLHGETRRSYTEVQETSQWLGGPVCFGRKQRWFVAFLS
jgi:hypothetical protein